MDQSNTPTLRLSPEKTQDKESRKVWSGIRVNNDHPDDDAGGDGVDVGAVHRHPEKKNKYFLFYT